MRHVASKLVHIVDRVPEIDDYFNVPGRHLTLIQSLDGFVDAGSAAERAVRALVDSSSESRVVATFDVDAFHDYRARRPAITFIRDHYDDYDAPRLVVRLLKDAGGIPYLLLQGPEPDNRWEAYARAVRTVVERFQVSTVISLHAVPMAVPHTRPMAITHHANNPDLIHEEPQWESEIRVPASAMALVEVRLGEWGHEAQGFVAHVPHYVAQLTYPAASALLLENVERAGRLTLDVAELKREAEVRQDEIARYLVEHDEVLEVVQALERQYDSFQRGESSGASLLAADQPLPTGEELGREFEKFLAGLDQGDEGGFSAGGPA